MDADEKAIKILEEAKRRIREVIHKMQREIRELNVTIKNIELKKENS